MKSSKADATVSNEYVDVGGHRDVVVRQERLHGGRATRDYIRRAEPQPFVEHIAWRGDPNDERALPSRWWSRRLPPVLVAGGPQGADTLQVLFEQLWIRCPGHLRNGCRRPNAT
jgi:hypothetical protein